MHAIGDLRGVARLDLEVLGRICVDHGKTGLDIVDEHDARLLAAQRRGDSLTVFGLGDLAVEFCVDGVG